MRGPADLPSFRARPSVIGCRPVLIASPTMSTSAPASLHQDVHRLLTGMYDDYLRGDPAAIDARLADDVTIFDSAAAELVVGLDDLAALRRRRAEARPDPAAPAAAETALTVWDLSIRDLDGVVVATWWLRVDVVGPEGEPLSPELSRNTAVLRRHDGGLRIAHLHEDVRQEAGAPA